MKQYIFSLLFLISACTVNETVTEYETQLKQIQLILEQNDKFQQEIETVFLDSEEHEQKIETYLRWVETNKPVLEEFKAFVEQHYKELEGVDKNPVLMRDLTIIFLNDLEQSDSFYQRCGAIYERYAATEDKNSSS